MFRLPFLRMEFPSGQAMSAKYTNFRFDENTIIQCANKHHRLRRVLLVLSETRERTGTPAFSVGVLHEGKVVLTYSEGFRDAGLQEPVDIDTAYLLG
jgi:CubicO group peptidase (beta-lactamase class C family)